MNNENAKPGDYVEIHLSKIIYEGILIQNPEDEKGVVLLKLDSGYNIGFNRKDILQIKLLRKARENEKDFEIKKDSKKPNIAMIITGGTIASRLNPSKGGVSPVDSAEKLFRYYPELFKHVNVSRIEIPFMKSSEDMDFRSWIAISRIAEKLLNEPDIKGLIITHGTDTLHYTSAALSFFLMNPSKPVVLTYSQRSIDRASSDANLNLQCSALAAISDIAEVMLVGHANTNDNFCYAMPGTKVRKLHSSRRDAFKVVNGKPFAKIFPDRIEIINSGFNTRISRRLTSNNPSLKIINKNSQKFSNKNNKVKADTKFESRIALVKIYPGQNPDILDFYLKKKYKGIVLEIFGLGHVPTKGKNSWLKKIKEIQEKGIVVTVVSQTIFGRLNPWVYSNARELLKTGAIYLEDMLSETAFVKLGWVLGHPQWQRNKGTIKEKMLTNFSHELNPRLEFDEDER